MDLNHQKIEQAKQLVRESDLDVWIVFVRETAEGSDPVLPLLVDGGLTWQSALLVSRSGESVAIIGNYDADPLASSGCWDKVVPYVQGITGPLLEELGRLVPPHTKPRLGINFSVDDVKADGLTHGMYLLLQSMLEGTRFAGSLVSAEGVAGALRSQKTADEVRRIRSAIKETDSLFVKIGEFARIGVSEAAVQRFVHSEIDRMGFGYGWERSGNPIVNSGPDSVVGHAAPSDSVDIQPGHIFHVDLGIVVEGYSSDIQRCWYVPRPDEKGIPEDVRQALEAVNGAISAGAAVLKPGAEGWEVDQAARRSLVEAGYPEYLHALGHQVGRMAHDGGAILGPKWERYGKTPTMPIQEGQVYTLELGVDVPGRGYLGLEEMVLIGSDGPEWLTGRQTSIQLLKK